MKRSAFLIPLSKEHHSALVLAKKCKNVAMLENKVQVELLAKEIKVFSEQNLIPHFKVEETQLFPLLLSAGEEELISKISEEHVILQELKDRIILNADKKIISSFGSLLKSHIRYEESVFFKKIEDIINISAPS